MKRSKMDRNQLWPFFASLIAACFCVCGATLVRGDAASQAAIPNTTMPSLFKAHSHNDYQHARPLLDALDHGFRSVEADLFLVDGELRVGHDRQELKAGRTLQALYLDPLRQRLTDAPPAPPQAPFLLWIDVKADGEKVYDELRRVLPRYGAMLSSVENGQLHPRAVTIVLSGAMAGGRSAQMLQAKSDAARYAFVDGRLADLETPLSGPIPPPASLLVFFSDSYRVHFGWNGTGPMPLEERSKLRDMVAKAHARGLRFRLWATPDTPQAWGELLDAGVDLINTDDLTGLRRFLLKRTGETALKLN